jgi:inorganic pyrophosphatase
LRRGGAFAEIKLSIGAVMKAASSRAKNLEVTIDTPKGSRAKFKFESGVIKLSKILPLGYSFPYNFGFVPGTKAQDGDPFDVLVLTDVPLPVGAVVEARIIGVFEAVQTEKTGKVVRNDRLIAVAVEDPAYEKIKTYEDLGELTRRELEHFFQSYNKLRNKKVESLGFHSPRKGLSSLAEARLS